MDILKCIQNDADTYKHHLSYLACPLKGEILQYVFRVHFVLCYASLYVVIHNISLSTIAYKVFTVSTVDVYF